MPIRQGYILSKTSNLPSGKILVLAPHADDEVIGCGGTIVGHVQKNNPVKIIIMTDSRQGDFDGIFGKEYMKLVEEETKAAISVLGVKDFELWQYPDRGLKVDTDLIERLLKLLMKYKPSVIYFPSVAESHPDHIAAYELVARTLPLIDFDVELYMYEVSMSLIPNIVIDITDYVGIKKKALMCYKTQLHYCDYIDKCLGLNRYRTYCLSKDAKYAEAFLKVDRKNLKGLKEIFDQLKHNIGTEGGWLFNTFPFLYSDKTWSFRMKASRMLKRLGTLCRK